MDKNKVALEGDEPKIVLNEDTRNKGYLEVEGMHTPFHFASLSLGTKTLENVFTGELESPAGNK